MNTRDWIIIHHTASSATLTGHQFDAVRKYHIGKGWGGIGYHWFVEYDGTIRAGRPEDQAGAHCKQWLMNYRSVGICLAGDFDEQDPSEAQLDALTALLTDVQLRNGIHDGKVKLHRDYASYKTCPGTRFTRDLLDSILFPRRLRQRIVEEPRPDLAPSHE